MKYIQIHRSPLKDDECDENHKGCDENHRVCDEKSQVQKNPSEIHIENGVTYPMAYGGYKLIQGEYFP